MQVLQKIIQVNRALGLEEGIVAFIELMLIGPLISVRSDGEHSSPETIVLAVGESENVCLSSDAVNFVLTHFNFVIIN